MATAQNGWPVIPLDQCETFLAPNGKLVYVEPSARDILGYLAWRWHLEVTPLPPATYNEGDGRDHRGGVRDGLVVIHGWRPGTKIKGTNVYSNHGSGLATDTNGHLHPYEYTSPKPYRDGFTSAQRTALRSFRGAIRSLGGADLLRIGLDFSPPRRDAMHLELWGTRAQLDRCAAAIRAAGWIIPTRRGQIADYQGIVGTVADDRHGPATTAAVKAFQRRLGVPRTGRWDVPTRDAWEAEKRRPDPAVRHVQRLLTDLGHDPGDIDGLPGPRTDVAVTAYATTYGYTGPRTAWAALTAHLEDTMSKIDTLLAELRAHRAATETIPMTDRTAQVHGAEPGTTLTLQQGLDGIMRNAFRSHAQTVGLFAALEDGLRELAAQTPGVDADAVLAAAREGAATGTAQALAEGIELTVSADAPPATPRVPTEEG